MKLDDLHQRMRDLVVADLRVALSDNLDFTPDNTEIDELFASCPGGECCDQCADIFCPYGEPLHFHHDGCPCCDMERVPRDQAKRRAYRHARYEKLLVKNT